MSIDGNGNINGKFVPYVDSTNAFPPAEDNLFPAEETNFNYTNQTYNERYQKQKSFLDQENGQQHENESLPHPVIEHAVESEILDQIISSKKEVVSHSFNEEPAHQLTPNNSHNPSSLAFKTSTEKPPELNTQAFKIVSKEIAAFQATTGAVPSSLILKGILTSQHFEHIRLLVALIEKDLVTRKQFSHDTTSEFFEDLYHIAQELEHDKSLSDAQKFNALQRDVIIPFKLGESTDEFRNYVANTKRELEILPALPLNQTKNASLHSKYHAEEKKDPREKYLKQNQGKRRKNKSRKLFKA